MLSIVIPAFNEENNIVATLESLTEASFLQSYPIEAFVITDGSRDRTPEIVQSWLSKPSVQIPNNLTITAKHLDLNIGLCRVALAGAALGKYKYFKIVCGDNPENSKNLCAIFKQVGRADIIIPYHININQKTSSRLALSKAYTLFYSLISGHFSAPYVNGCFVCPRELFLKYCNPSHRFGFQAYVLYRLFSLGLSEKIVTIDGLYHASENGTPISLRNLLGVSFSFFRIFLSRGYHLIPKKSR